MGHVQPSDDAVRSSQQRRDWIPTTVEPPCCRATSIDCDSTIRTPNECTPMRMLPLHTCAPTPMRMRRPPAHQQRLKALHAHGQLANLSVVSVAGGRNHGVLHQALPVHACLVRRHARHGVNLLQRRAAWAACAQTGGALCESRHCIPCRRGRAAFSGMRRAPCVQAACISRDDACGCGRPHAPHRPATSGHTQGMQAPTFEAPAGSRLAPGGGCLQRSSHPHFARGPAGGQALLHQPRGTRRHLCCCQHLPPMALSVHHCSCRRRSRCSWRCGRTEDPPCAPLPRQRGGPQPPAWRV